MSADPITIKLPVLDWEIIRTHPNLNLFGVTVGEADETSIELGVGLAALREIWQVAFDGFFLETLARISETLEERGQEISSAGALEPGTLLFDGCRQVVEVQNLTLGRVRVYLSEVGTEFESHFVAPASVGIYALISSPTKEVA